MPSSEQFKSVVNGRECLIFVSGAVNEETHFPVIEVGDCRVFLIDMEKVTTLNSMGLRNWIVWMKSLKGRIQINFRNCPRVVVDQMNILQGFLPEGAIIESFYVPYHCESCGHDELYLATRGRDYMEATVDAREGVVLKDQHPCIVCGEIAKWDVIPAKYFAFLKLRR